MNTDFFYFDPEVLLPLADRSREAYASAAPFPHIVLDDFLPEEILNKALAEFPAPEEKQWAAYRDADQNKKLAAENDAAMGDFTRHLLSQFNASVFVNFLERLTGIAGLIPDPHFRGGGLHQIERGGFLGVHADFNHYKRLNVERRINALVYLNKNWKEEYGGHLELWNKDMTQCEKKVLPIFNRCVIFSTTDTAYHGHPEPLACPEGMTRKSLALYYYTAGRPASEQSAPHSTIFRKRPGEREKISGRKILIRVAKSIAPPIILDALGALKKKTKKEKK